MYRNVSKIYVPSHLGAEARVEHGVHDAAQRGDVDAVALKFKHTVELFVPLSYSFPDTVCLASQPCLVSRRAQVVWEQFVPSTLITGWRDTM